MNCFRVPKIAIQPETGAAACTDAKERAPLHRSDLGWPFAMLSAALVALVAGCALPWHSAPAEGTTLMSTLDSMASYQRIVAGARACYPWPSYKIEPDYFQPTTKTGQVKLFRMDDDLEKVEMVAFRIGPTRDGSSVNLKYRNAMSGFPRAAAAWLNGEPDRCPAR